MTFTLSDRTAKRKGKGQLTHFLIATALTRDTEPNFSFTTDMPNGCNN